MNAASIEGGGPTFATLDELEGWALTRAESISGIHRVMRKAMPFAMIDVAHEIIRVRMAHKHLRQEPTA